MTNRRDPRAGRPFVARTAAVSTPHQLASSSALAILAQGGSAVDAMVAANAVLGVVAPHMGGPGGDAFWVVHERATHRTVILNATGRAGQAATRECYRGAGNIPSRGVASVVTVPGAVDGWLEAHRRFGRLPLADCLAPAVGYATDGFPVSRGLARWMATSRALLKQWPATATCFLHDDGSPYAEGERLVLLDLAATLTLVAEGGRRQFYEGALATRMVENLAPHGGILTREDFAAHRSEWVEPIALRYRGWTVLTTPPNSQGFATLAILGILTAFDVAGLADDPVGYIDLMARATEAAFEDRDRYLGDPSFSPVPLDMLLGETHLAELRRRTGRGPSSPPDSRPTMGGDTTFSCAVDGEGNVAGVIQSVYFEWGSGVVAGGTGVLLQNRGSFFSLDSTHPNCLEPGKRTFHTLCATLLVDESGHPGLVLGTMGGEGQPQTQAAVITRVVDHRMNVQEAVDAPRWLLGRTWGEEHRGLRIEDRLGFGTAVALSSRGHQNVSCVEGFSELMGHAQAIRILPGRLEAAADPRSDGAALGL